MNSRADLLQVAVPLQTSSIMSQVSSLNSHRVQEVALKATFAADCQCPGQICPA